MLSPIFSITVKLTSRTQKVAFTLISIIYYYILDYAIGLTTVVFVLYKGTKHNIICTELFNFLCFN